MIGAVNFLLSENKLIRTLLTCPHGMNHAFQISIACHAKYSTYLCQLPVAVCCQHPMCGLILHVYGLTVSLPTQKLTLL